MINRERAFNVIIGKISTIVFFYSNYFYNPCTVCQLYGYGRRHTTDGQEIVSHSNAYEKQRRTTAEST